MGRVDWNLMLIGRGTPEYVSPAPWKAGSVSAFRFLFFLLLFPPACVTVAGRLFRRKREFEIHPHDKQN